MIIRDIMTTHPITLLPQQRFSKATRSLVYSHINGAPIVDDDGALIGLITKGHILKAIIEGSKRDTPIA